MPHLHHAAQQWHVQVLGHESSACAQWKAALLSWVEGQAGIVARDHHSCLQQLAAEAATIKQRTYALDLVGPGGAAADHRRLARLHRQHLQGGGDSSGRRRGQGVRAQLASDAVCGRQEAQSETINSSSSSSARKKPLHGQNSMPAPTCTLGFCSLRNLPVPEMVPPVPTPPTRMSTVPPEAAQISGPVVS